jgi:hypothetical protein
MVIVSAFLPISAPWEGIVDRDGAIFRDSASPVNGNRYSQPFDFHNSAVPEDIATIALVLDRIGSNSFGSQARDLSRVFLDDFPQFTG